jgi:hypothetical protein
LKSRLPLYRDPEDADAARPWLMLAAKAFVADCGTVELGMMLVVLMII